MKKFKFTATAATATTVAYIVTMVTIYMHETMLAAFGASIMLVGGVASAIHAYQEGREEE